MLSAGEPTVPAMTTDSQTWLPARRSAEIACILDTAWTAAVQFGDRGVLITRSADFSTFVAVPSVDVEPRVIVERLMGAGQSSSSSEMNRSKAPDAATP